MSAKIKNRRRYIFLVLPVLICLFCGIIVWGLLETFYGLSISPDGKFLVVTDRIGVSIYRTNNGFRILHAAGEPYGATPYGQGENSTIAWSPNGDYLAVGKRNNGIWIWNVSTWQMVSERDGGEETEYFNPGFAWSPDGNQLALGTGRGEVWLWEKLSNTWVMKDSSKTQLVGIHWDPSGKLVMLRGYDLIDVETGQYLGRLNHWIDGIGNVTWSPDEKHVYVYFDLGGGVMDVDTNKATIEAGFFPEYAWSMDGKYFASVSECTNQLQVWDTSRNKMVREESQGNVIYALSWTADGDLLALGVKDFSTVVWNTDTGKVLLRLFVPPNLYCVFN